MSNLDYLYSDSINVLTALNQEIQKKQGSLGILGAPEKVLGILKQAGLHKQLKVFAEENEVLQFSNQVNSVDTSSSYISHEPANPNVSLPTDSSFAGVVSELEEALEEVPSPDLLPLATENTSPPPATPRSPTQNVVHESEAKENPLKKPNSQDADDSAINKQKRISPQERLRNPSARSSMKTRAGGRMWGASDSSNSGLVVVDENDQSTADVSASDSQRSKPNSSLYDDKKPQGSKKALLIVIALLALLGGAFFVIQMSGSDEPEQTTAEVTPNPAPAATTPTTPPAVEESLSASSPATSNTPSTPAPTPPVENKPVAPKVEKVVAPPPKPVPPKVESKPAEVKTEKPASAKSDTKPEKVAPAPSTPAEESPLSESEPPKPKPVPNPKVKITSVPLGAIITLDGKKIGTAPRTVEITSTNSKLVLEKKGYEPYTVELNKETVGKTVSGTLTKIAPPPAPKPAEATKEPEVVVEEKKPEPEAPKVAPSAGGPEGKVFIASRPPGADIFVNGRDIDVKTPSWVNLPLGKVNITLKKDDQSGSKELNVSSGKNKSEYIILE